MSTIFAQSSPGGYFWRCVRFYGDTKINRLPNPRARANATDNDGGTPLLWAAERGHTETCKLLLDHGAEVNAKDEDGWSPLHKAEENGHTETCELLRQYGAK